MSFASWLGRQPWLAKTRHLVIPLDRALYRLTGGKITTMSFGGPTGLTLITTGAKTGERRENPMQYVADDDGMIVVGSNWGRPNHPAWTVNLLKNPDAQANVNGVVRDVHATLLEGAEREAAWQKLIEVWPAYELYVRRSGRQPRVFRLVRR